MEEKETARKIKVSLKHRTSLLSKVDSPERSRVFSLNRLHPLIELSSSNEFMAKRDAVEQELCNHSCVQENLESQRLMKKLRTAFIHEKVLEFYAFHFMSRLLYADPKEFQVILKGEVESIVEKRSHYHFITSAIKSREESLEQLNKIIEFLSFNEENTQAFHTFREEILRYRINTRLVISQIRSWKHYLNSISTEMEQVSFLYFGGSDYESKMLRDCSFFFNCFLSEKLKFSQKNDPFLMRPWVEGMNKEFEGFDEKSLVLFQFDESEKNEFMIDLKFLAVERTKKLKRKTLSNYNKIRDIEKVYHKDSDRSSLSRILNKSSSKDKLRLSIFKKLEPAENNFFTKFSNASPTQRNRLEEIGLKTERIERVKDLLFKNEKRKGNTMGTPKSSQFEKGSSEEYSQRHIKSSENTNFESDLEFWKRKKEIKLFSKKMGSRTDVEGELVESAREKTTELKKQRSMKILKINDIISQNRRYLNKEEGVKDLEELLGQLDTFSPRKFDSLKANGMIGKSELSMNSLKNEKQEDNMIKQNEESYGEIRRKVIEEIETGNAEKIALEEKNREEKSRIQENLHKKMNSALDIIKSDQLIVSERKGSENNENGKELTKEQEIEEELRKEIQLKWQREVQEELQIITKQNEEQKFEEEKNKEKFDLLKRYEEIEREERAKMIEEQTKLDEERRAELEEEMKNVIEREKNNMKILAAEQRKEAEEKIKLAMKEEMLQNLKETRIHSELANEKAERQSRIESTYRLETKEAIGREYEASRLDFKEQERENRESRIRQVKEKLDQFNNNSRKIESEKRKSPTKIIESESVIVNKSELRNNVTEIPDFRERVFEEFEPTEDHKKKLRSQFEKELFSIRKPNVTEEESKKESEAKETFIIKDYKKLVDSQIESIDLKQKNEVNLILAPSHSHDTKKGMLKSESSEIFNRFSRMSEKEKDPKEDDELIRNKLGMSVEQYLIYKKKKNAISLINEEWENTKKQEIEEKSLMDPKVKNVSREDPEATNYLSVVRNRSKTFNEEGIDEGERIQKAYESQIIKKVEKKSEESIKKNSLRGSKSKERKMKNKNESILSSKIEVEKRFATSEGSESGDEYVVESNRKRSKTNFILAEKLKTNVRQEEINKNVPVSQNSFMKVADIPDQPLTITKLTKIKLELLDEFLTDHFDNLPNLQKSVSTRSKEDLKKLLLEQSCFTIIEYIKENLSFGFGIAIANENKHKYRSIDLIHVGSYDEKDYLEVLINVARYCFKNDPCSEVTYSIYFGKEENNEWEFVKDFEKEFNPFGSIFEKKLSEEKFERKFVLKRGVGEFCKVSLSERNYKGNLELDISIFMADSINEAETKDLIHSDEYNVGEATVGYYGLFGNLFSKKYSSDTLAYIISKSITKESTSLEKSLGSLSKLALLMKGNSKTSSESEIQLESQTFENVLELNVELVSKELPVLPYPRSKIDSPLSIQWSWFKAKIELSYSFTTQTIEIEANQKSLGEKLKCRYLRFKPNKKNKMFTLKSKVSSNYITVLPCKDVRYKIFIIDSQDYDAIVREKGDNTDLGAYVKVLFGNLEEHHASAAESIWIPQIKIEEDKNEISCLSEFALAEHNVLNLEDAPSTTSFKHTSGVVKANLSLVKTNYLENSLNFQPTHRDNVIAPPFIMGVLSMEIETVQEGSPVYVRRITENDLIKE